MLDQEQDEYTSLALQSSKRLTRLLSDILDLSRVEAGMLSINSELFDLRGIVDQVAELFMPIQRESGVALKVELSPSVPRKIVGDPTRLQQVFANLIGNAFKFTDSGSVTVEAYPLPAVNKEQVRVLFSISDTGVGIADDVLDNLFMPFVQGYKGHTRVYQGAGLGLSICKRLTELMGGNISIASEFGKGTTVFFCCTFLRDETVAATPSPEALRKELSANTAYVLLVEDDNISSITAAKLMEKLGYSVKKVEDGRKALEALRHESFDVVMMDVQMPVMDGVTATEAVRRGEAGEENRDIPIIAVTGYAMPGDKETFLSAGMNDYLVKPIEVVALQEVLQRAMETGEK